MSLIKFVGIPGKKDHYLGFDNEVELKIKEGETREVSQGKAYQLLKDFPKEWELVGEDRKEFLKMYANLYDNKMLGGANATKGFTVIDPWGHKNVYPPDVEVIIRRSQNVKGDEILNPIKGNLTVCKTPGCKTILGKGEKCEKHKD